MTDDRLREADRIMVPARLLRCDWPPNDGVKPGDPQFDALFASIKEEGVKVPLVIRIDWLVIDGAHRLNAARLLGIDWLPVRFWTGVEMVP
jgi:ParB-like chromosome segregation protein Spo0J